MSRRRFLRGLPPVRSAILFTAVAWLACFYGLNSVELIDLADEGRYATVARQMLESGDWVTPRIGSNTFLEKPPLHYWFQAFTIKLLGPIPAAARLPSSIAALLTALVLWAWGAHRGMATEGFTAALLYLLSPLLMFGPGRFATMDSLLTLWLTIAILSLIEGYKGSPGWYVLAAAASALAVLTKGVIGGVLPATAFLVFLAIRRNPGELIRLAWLAATACFLIMVLPWHVAMWNVHGYEFVYQYFERHHIHRFLGLDFAHNAPFWYYIPVLLVGMFPWIVFSPAALWHALKFRSARESTETAIAFLGVFALVTFLFFSMSISKLPGYILPAFPALAFVVAIRLARLKEHQHRPTRWEWISLAFLSFLVGSFLLALGVLARHLEAQGWPPDGVVQIFGRALEWPHDPDEAARLWISLSPAVVMYRAWIAVGVLFLLWTAATILFRKDLKRLLVTTFALNAMAVLLAIPLGLTAWSNHDIAPLNDLGRRLLPELDRGELLVLHTFHPARTSLRYVLGHTDQIIEPGGREIAVRVMNDRGRGYLIVARDTPLPPYEGHMILQAVYGRWTLWRFEK